MNRSFAVASFVGVILATCLAACDGGTEHRIGKTRQSQDCRQFGSCGSCTPVLGCGWCFNANGRGTCASDPDQCVTAQFSWTWEPEGCYTTADASVGVANPTLRDAAAAAPDAADAATCAADAGDADAACAD